jgi:hypothetical protein
MADGKNANQELIRNFFTQQCANLTAMIGQLAEPYATEFRKLQNQYEAVLKTLPLTDQVPAALEANYHLTALFSALQANQYLVSYLGGEIAGMKKKHDEMLAARESETQQLSAATQKCAELEKKIADGDLLDKTKVTELCSAAKTTGLAEGEANATTRVRAEVEARAAAQKTIGDRKTALAAEKLPVPPIDDLLAGKDEEYAARKTKATERAEALKKKGFALNSRTMGELAWVKDDDYARQLALIDQVLSERGTPAAAFITAGQHEGDVKLPGGAY